MQRNEIPKKSNIPIGLHAKRPFNFLSSQLTKSLFSEPILHIVWGMADGDVLFEQALALLLDGEGGESLMKSAALMRRAADSGHAAAANNFGAMLHHGRGVHQDFAAARAYYAQAAEAGLAPAMFNLGFMKLRALGGERNEVEARALFEKAAHLGEVLWVLGNRDAAREIWQDALEVQPDSEFILNTMERLRNDTSS